MRKASKEKKRALITGASSGIGAAFARHLARDGYDVVLVARSRERLDDLAGELQAQHGVAAEALPADLTDPPELHIVEEMLADGVGLDLLVNNAGFGTGGAFRELEVNQEESEIRLNVVALVRLTRAALPSMVARNSGAIINVSSLAGFQAAPFNATYGATKAFVNSFTESLAEELRGSAVKVQMLCPGFTRTEFQERASLDVSGVPSFAWMSAEAVVDASLTALQRGDLVCIPGMQNKMVATLTSLLPRSLTRRVSGMLTRSVVKLEG
ncbi:MAG: SDR family oxidoreductase [Deltaproteobacteria bacterium]|nr:SDR family oxidoreductase [Deltaproteobacteria bacterium]